VNAKIVEFDIDGTLTEPHTLEQDDRAGSYIHAKPNASMIKLVREAFAAGWTVTIHTGRRWEQKRLTESWLAQQGVPYHFLIMGKHPCTYRIDDVNISATGFRRVLSEPETK
jgi:uncharacterized HAD superfamily protein